MAEPGQIQAGHTPARGQKPDRCQSRRNEARRAAPIKSNLAGFGGLDPFFVNAFAAGLRSLPTMPDTALTSAHVCRIVIGG
jgi:hypothetical protein